MTIKTLEEACALMRKNDLANAADTVVLGYDIYESTTEEMKELCKFPNFVDGAADSYGAYTLTQSADVPPNAILFKKDREMVALVEDGKFYKPDEILTFKKRFLN